MLGTRAFDISSGSEEMLKMALDVEDQMSRRLG